MRPVLTWPGNKRLLAERIVALLPKHETYVEPFGGALAVLLAKPRSKVEIVNDLNGDLVVFYRVVRYHLEELLKELDATLNSRQEFEDFGREPGLTDIQRAARWFIRNKLSFGGKGSHYAPRTDSRANQLERLRELRDRLDRVAVEHLDWTEVVARHDKRGACFYFDPPYVEGYQYDVGAWKLEDHIALRDVLLNMKARWVLSYDDVPLVRELYADAGCRFNKVTRPRGIGNNHKTIRREFKEVIICR